MDYKRARCIAGKLGNSAVRKRAGWGRWKTQGTIRTGTAWLALGFTSTCQHGANSRHTADEISKAVPRCCSKRPGFVQGMKQRSDSVPVSHHFGGKGLQLEMFQPKVEMEPSELALTGHPPLY